MLGRVCTPPLPGVARGSTPRPEPGKGVIAKSLPTHACGAGCWWAGWGGRGQDLTVYVFERERTSSGSLASGGSGDGLPPLGEPSDIPSFTGRQDVGIVCNCPVMCEMLIAMIGPRHFGLQPLTTLTTGWATVVGTCCGANYGGTALRDRNQKGPGSARSPLHCSPPHLRAGYLAGGEAFEHGYAPPGPCPDRNE